MLKASLSFRALTLALLISAVGCHAQVPAAAKGKALSPQETWKVEAMLRSSAQLPPETEIFVGERTPSELAGYDEVPVRFKVDGKESPPSIFLVSTDGKWMAQFRKLDLSQDPKEKVSAADRPGRGGPANAPVLIVGFDDLQCPFCARLHSELFPAMLKRYGDSVHVVYRDFPLDQHPWAMRAAVDVNCLGTQNATGYWNLVDYIHIHAGELWNNDPKTISKTNDELDRLTREEGKKQAADTAKLDACIAKQDITAIEASRTMGQKLNVTATPVLYVNGAKVEGAVSPEFVFKIIDQALIVQGKTPPSPFVPAPAATVAPKP